MEEYSVWGGGVAGSNPVTCTIQLALMQENTCVMIYNYIILLLFF